jgi:hypothetical protein
MLKNIVLIFSSSLITAACVSEDVRGVLVGGFSDADPIVTAIVIPASQDGEYHLHYGFRQEDRVCLLSGELPTASIPYFQSCAGLRGTGKISCNDGRALNLKWVLDSCQSGYGRSDGRADSRFTFGFGDSEERGRDQLEKARRED